MDRLLKLPQAAISEFAEHDGILPEQVGGRLLGALARRPHTAVAGRGVHSMAQVPVVGQPGFYRQMGDTPPRALAKVQTVFRLSSKIYTTGRKSQAPRGTLE
jgi:hypothetical protein